MGSESSKREDSQITNVPAEGIEQTILLIRGEKVILDVDLAALYGVTTKRLNQQVTRNLDRFPGDFMFRLNRKEVTGLRLHFATSTGARGGLRYLPYAFTEHGAIMAASVLNTRRADRRHYRCHQAPHGAARAARRSRAPRQAPHRV
jgi:hypothetical protein